MAIIPVSVNSATDSIIEHFLATVEFPLSNSVNLKKKANFNNTDNIISSAALA